MILVLTWELSKSMQCPNVQAWFTMFKPRATGCILIVMWRGPTLMKSSNMECIWDYNTTKSATELNINYVEGAEQSLTKGTWCGKCTAMFHYATQRNLPVRAPLWSWDTIRITWSVLLVEHGTSCCGAKKLNLNSTLHVLAYSKELWASWSINSVTNSHRWRRTTR